MADINNLTSSVASPQYPTFQPIQQINPLTQMQGALSMAQQQQNLQSGRLDLMQKNLGIISNLTGTLATKQDGLTPADFSDLGTRMLQMGIDPTLIHQEMQRVSQIAPPGSDPSDPKVQAGLRGLALEYHANTTDAMQKQGLIYGNNATVNSGDYVIPGKQSVQTGGFTPGGAPISMGMTPEAKANRFTGQDNSGRPYSAPMSSVTNRQGYALPTPIMPQQGGSAASTMAPQGMSGAPGAPGSQAQPSPGAGASGLPAGAVQTGLPAGQGRFIDASTDRMMSDLDGARGVQGDLNPLVQARNGIMALGKNGIGPGTEDRNKVASFLQSAGLGWLPGVDSGRIENMDEALKYTTQAMQGRAAAMRAGTDQQQATTAAGSPNLKMSTPAALNVLNSMIGLRRMQQAQTFENAGSAADGPNYAFKTAKWAANQDPRAYSFDLMSDDQKQKVMASLGAENSPAYKRFVASLRSAHGTGLLNQ